MFEIFCAPRRRARGGCGSREGPLDAAQSFGRGAARVRDCAFEAPRPSGNCSSRPAEPSLCATQQPGITMATQGDVAAGRSDPRGAPRRRGATTRAITTRGRDQRPAAATMRVDDWPRAHIMIMTCKGKQCVNRTRDLASRSLVAMSRLRHHSLGLPVRRARAVLRVRRPAASNAARDLDRRTARQRRPLGGCCCWGCPIVAARRAKKAPAERRPEDVWRRPRTTSPRRFPRRLGAPRPARVPPVRRRSPRARPAAPRPRTCSRTPSLS